MKKRADNRKQIHIPEGLHAHLKAVADERVVSIHYLCERLLTDALDRLPPLPGVSWDEKVHL